MTWLLLLGLVVAGMCLLILAGPTLVIYHQVFGLIAPGVHARGVNLGGFNVPGAAARLNQAWNVDYKIDAGWFNPGGVESWLVTPPELGLFVDGRATAEKAYQIGRGQGGFMEMISGFWQKREVPLVLHFDPQLAQAGLEILATMANQAPQNATLRLEGANLVAVPAVPGHTLDIDSALAALSADPYSVLLQGYLVLPMQTVEPRITDVSAVLAEAEKLLSSSPKVVAYDPLNDERLQWPVTREMLASWLVIQEGEAGPQLSLDPAQVTQFLASQSQTLGDGRWLDVDEASQRLAQAASQGKRLVVTVRHYPTTYTVQQGDTLLRIGWNIGIPYWMMLEANPGLDEKSMWVGQEINVPSKDDLLPLPVVPEKRIVISISEQRLWTYQNGEQRSEHVISTGIDRSPTQPGVFQIRSHELEAYASVWDLYMPHFLGIYEAWPGFMNGIHGLPTLSSGVRLWANILGRPASYGCIILDLDAAEDLYNWAEEGVVVEIRP